MAAGNAVELAQVWVPLMPEASRLAQGVKKIGDDATRAFERSTRVMGAQMASSFTANSRKVVDSLRDVEKFTSAAAKAKKADADAAGRLALALKKLEQVNGNAKSTDLQRATAAEGVARAQRAQELTTSNLTRVTKQLTAAQKAQQAAQNALKNPVETKMPLGARLAAQAEQYGVDSGTRYIAGFKRVLGATTALAVGGGFLAAAKQAIDLGVGMESNLNRLQGVTSATAQEMAEATAVAKQLGADTTIVGASAADAAAAMLELAKGGLTMQQALAAAPGTLRLAAAAQIDAATAAESQATILNSFQLDPDQADRVADALANVANAAQGEVPDFMLGLQQAAAVAHGFNISMEDTVAALGLFAKAGIRGSDAGTSIKTMLTHLANPSDQAAGAMADLGIQAHDLATGEFVGLPKLFEQISAAAGRMRPDDFQRAAATLFGTDAIRGAMLAGNQGVETLHKMQEEVGQLGGATRMAASNMQGLPGTLEKLSNSADNARLALYDLVKPMLQSAGEKGVEWLNKAAEAVDSLKKGGGGGAVGMVAAGWRDISGAVKDIAPVLGQVIAQFVRGAGATVIAGWRALGLAMKVIEPPLKFIAEIFTAIPGLGTGVAALLTALYLKSKLAGPALTAAAKATEVWGKAFAGWKTPADQATKALGAVTAASGEAVNQQRGFVTRLRDVYSDAASQSGRFSRTMGAGKAAMSGFKMAGAGLFGLLGGPWGLAITGATLGLGYLAQKHQEAADKAEAQRQAEEALRNTLNQSTGDMTAETVKQINQTLADAGELEKAKLNNVDPNLLLRSATGDTDAYKQFRDQASKALQTAIPQDVINRAQKAGVTFDELTGALLREPGAWDSVNRAMRDAGIGTLDDLTRSVSGTGTAFIQMGQAANNQLQMFYQQSEKQELFNEAMYGTWKATEAGIEKFKELGATILSVPNDHTIKVEAPDVDKVREQFEQTGATVTQIPGTKMVIISADTDQAKAALKDMVVQVEDANPLLHIDADTAKATDAIDEWKRYMAGQPPVNIPVTTRPSNAGDVILPPAYRPPGGATGGRVVGDIIRGPGSGTSDSILAQATNGQLLRVANGESINTEASTRRNYPFIQAMNRGWVPSRALLSALTNLPRYSQGGLLDYAESIVGTPYSQASRWDCSGTVARLVNQATGMGGGDLMTTKNAAEWLAARGFVEGLGGPDDFSVGWYDHGGGPNSGHMAATLPGGVNAEQGGKNGAFVLGGDAAGADSPQFDHHMYLPADALWPEGSGGGGGSSSGSGGSGGGYSSQSAKSTAVTKAENDLKQADRTVAEKEARLAEVNAKAKATDSEKMRAENQLTKAKEDREEKKAKLDEVRNKPVKSGKDADGKSSGGTDASSFGQDLMKGALQALGFDGEIFSDPTQWGIFKLGTSMANIFGGVMKNWNWEGFADATDGGRDLGRPLRGPIGDRQHGLGGSPGPGNFGVGDGGLGGFDFGDGGGAGMSAVGDTFLPQARDTLANSQNPAPVPPTGLLPSIDNSVTVNATGLDPNAVVSTWRAEQNARTRTYGSGLPRPV